jgi:hypothetical protein
MPRQLLYECHIFSRVKSSETLLHVSKYRGAIVSKELTVSISRVTRNVEVHAWKYDTLSGGQ